MLEKIAVFGADANIGTTMISMGIAEILTSLGEEEIMYIDCSDKLYEGYTGLPFFKTNGIDMIGRVVETLQTVYKVGDYKAILGPRSRNPISYDPDTVERIIKDLGPDMHRIILDAGSDPRNMLSIGALKVADRRIYVIRQNPKCLDKFELAVENILRPNGLYTEKDIVILNAERKTNLLLSEKDISGRLLRNIHTLPFIRDGIKCEYRKCTLTTYSKKFNNALKKIVVKEL